MPTVALDDQRSAGLARPIPGDHGDVPVPEVRHVGSAAGDVSAGDDRGCRRVASPDGERAREPNPDTSDRIAAPRLPRRGVDVCAFGSGVTPKRLAISGSPTSIERHPFRMDPIATPRAHAPRLGRLLRGGLDELPQHGPAGNSSASVTDAIGADATFRRAERRQ